MINNKRKQTTRRSTSSKRNKIMEDKRTMALKSIEELKEEF